MYLRVLGDYARVPRFVMNVRPGWPSIRQGQAGGEGWMGADGVLYSKQGLFLNTEVSFCNVSYGVSNL